MLRYAGFMKLPVSTAVISAFLATVCLCQDTADPWPKTAVVEPAAFAKTLQSGKAPMVIPRWHLPALIAPSTSCDAVRAGRTSKPEGIESAQESRTLNLPKDADIVIYSRLLPDGEMPKYWPAYRTLKDLGFTRVRVLDIATNMHTDWYSKDYPSENGPAANSETK